MSDTNESLPPLTQGRILETLENIFPNSVIKISAKHYSALITLTQTEDNRILMASQFEGLAYHKLRILALDLKTWQIQVSLRYFK